MKSCFAVRRSPAKHGLLIHSNLVEFILGREAIVHLHGMCKLTQLLLPTPGLRLLPHSACAIISVPAHAWRTSE
eukprot:scaffold196344_cov32-Tisochrysis_lutea.AAC.3